MSDISNSIGSISWLSRHKFNWLALLLLTVLLIFATYWGTREWSADQANRNQFAQWADAGIPYDSASMQKSYEGRTHPEGTADWLKIHQLIDWGHQVEAFKRLPYIGYEGKALAVLLPGGEAKDWPDEVLVASYLEEMEPVIDLIEQASSHPKPVRFPIKFQGMATLLPHIQNSRSFLRLLALDCDFAYFNQDKERALRDLTLMQSTAEAYDGRECLVSELVNIALRGIRMGAIRRTLTHCAWSPAELDSLRHSLQPTSDLSTRWREVWCSERAFGLSMVSESPEALSAALQEPQNRFPIRAYPSDVRTLIDAYQAMIELPVAPVSDLRKRAEALEARIQATIPSNSFAGMILPAFQQVLQAEIRAEDVRRWTLTAVAIQQYKQENGEWPKKLANLESIRLGFDEYSDTERNVFGYEVDGAKAFLWKQDSEELETIGRISPTRPQPKVNKDAIYHLLELN